MIDVKEEAQLAIHPCFDTNGCHRIYGRIHLPVAKNCNIRCNYCLPKFDCLNESRPGVTSKLLSPDEAIAQVSHVLKKISSIKVIGIAGPGDPLYNEETFETLALLKEIYPEFSLCLSTNGLLLLEKLEELKRLRVKFLTITINAIDAEVGNKIYAWIFWEGRKLYGLQGAQLLIERQWQGIEKAVRMGFFVKVNTVMIPTINITEIPKIAQKLQKTKVWLHNIIPLIPVKRTKLADLPLLSEEERFKLQLLCEKFVPQMFHCRQCRADAVGLLGEDSRLNFLPEEKSSLIKVAVASKDEGLVDTHFGHAKEFKIYQIEKNSKCLFLEKRLLRKPYCYGQEECLEGKDYLVEIISALSDCKALFCLHIGWEPAKRLKEAGIEVVTTYDRIEEAIEKFFQRKKRG